MSFGIPKLPLFDPRSPRVAVRVVVEVEGGVMPPGDLAAVDRLQALARQYALWASLGVEGLVEEWHPDRLVLVDEHLGATSATASYQRLDVGRRIRLATRGNQPRPKREIPPDLAAELVEAEEVVAALRLHPRLLGRVRELLG